MNNYEFDKIALSIALAVFAIVFCVNIGDLIYYPEISVEKRGYKIEVPENHNDNAKKEEVIEA